MRPAELLALCHVNKGFRNMLVTDEKARLVWVGSREYHGIPQPFEDFDEYTWASLIFGRICTVKSWLLDGPVLLLLHLTRNAEREKPMNLTSA